MAANITRFFHIEVVVPDAEAAYKFLNRVFGAQKVEKEMVERLNEAWRGEAKVIHVGIGGVVLQLVELIEKENIVPFLKSWHDQLKERGPSIHNLLWLVEDINKAIKALESECTSSISIEAEKKVVFGPEAGSSNLTVHLVDAMDKVGFKIELLEDPFKGKK